MSFILSHTDNNIAIHELIPSVSVRCAPTRPSGAGRPAGMAVSISAWWIPPPQRVRCPRNRVNSTASMDRAPVGKRRLAGHRQRHHGVSAKPELAALAVHRQPLLPSLRASRLDEQVQAMPIEVAPRRRDCLHPLRRQGMMQAPAAALRFARHVSHRSDSSSPQVYSGTLTVTLQSWTLLDSARPRWNRYPALTACSIEKKRAEVAELLGWGTRIRT